jgi:hypothetical protein
MTKQEKAIKLAWLINDEGKTPYDATEMLGLEDGVNCWGEDIGDECLDLTDASNDVIDLGWEDDELTHYQLKRRYSVPLQRKVWEVERMQLLTRDGKEVVTSGA